MRLGSWKSQIGLVMMMVISGPVFAKPPKGDISSADATDPSIRSCGKDANKITFNVDGKKDYYIGHDVENNGAGWYFSGQGGEIVTSKDDGTLCVQMGMRLNTGTKADAGNKMGAPQCGSAINPSRQVLDANGAYKEYLWQWDDKQKVLKITPLKPDGSWDNPVLKISGNTSKAQRDQKGSSSIHVEAETIAGVGNQQGKGFNIDASGEPTGSQPTSEKTCLLGQLESNGKDQVDISMYKDEPVKKSVGSGKSQPVVQNIARAAK